MHPGGHRCRQEPASAVGPGHPGQRLCGADERVQLSGLATTGVYLVTNLTPASKVWETPRGRDLKDKCCN